MQPDTDFDWAKIRQKFGTCAHVPAALQELCSADEATRDAAYRKLDNNVILQGDLSEAAPFVVRALNALLRSSIPSRVGVYDFLVELANGHAADGLCVRIDGSEKAVLQATRESLIQGLDIYEQDLETTNVQVRRLVGHLLLGMQDYSDLDLGKVRRVREVESDPKVQELLDELIEDASGPPAQRT